MLELRTHEQIKDISGAMRSLWDLTTRLKKNGKYHDARKAYQKYIGWLNPVFYSENISSHFL